MIWRKSLFFSILTALLCLGSSQNQVDPGYTVWKNMTAAWDFSRYPNYELDQIQENVKDITGNGNDFVPQSGAIWTRSQIGLTSISCFSPPGYINTYDLVNSLKLSAAKTQALFNGDWDMFILMQQRSTGTGGYMCVTDNSTHYVKIYQGGRQMIVSLAAGSTACSTSPTTFFDNQSVGTVLVRIKRINGVSLQLYKNGVPFTSTITGASANHSGLTLTADWYLGCYNLNGVKSGSLTTRDQNYIMMCIKKGTVTDQQANDLQHWMYSKFDQKF